MSLIDEYDRARPYRTLEQRCSAHQTSPAWEDADRPPIPTFICDDGNEWSVPFVKIDSLHLLGDELVVAWKPGTISIKGPKVREFRDQFARHEANAAKADGKDILAITFLPCAS